MLLFMRFNRSKLTNFFKGLIFVMLFLLRLSCSSWVNPARGFRSVIRLDWSWSPNKLFKLARGFRFAIKLSGKVIFSADVNLVSGVMSFIPLLEKVTSITVSKSFLESFRSGFFAVLRTNGSISSGVKGQGILHICCFNARPKLRRRRLFSIILPKTGCLRRLRTEKTLFWSFHS